MNCYSLRLMTIKIRKPKIMKRRMLIQIVSIASGLAAAFATFAGPLQRADVAGEPAWLAHVDCDKLRSSSLGQFFLAELDKPEAKDKLAALQTIFSFDLRKQLHGLTLYSTSDSPEDGVLLVY